MNNPAPGTRQVPQVDLWPAPCSQHRGSSAARLSVRLLWGYKPPVPQDDTWAAPYEVARPIRSRRTSQDYRLY
jgi:hypothetical protein